jgi:type IV secretory pathway VirJ component
MKMRKLILPIMTALFAACTAPAWAQSLPLHVVDGGRTTASTAAIYLTGDGGWAAFDQRVVADLAKAGVPTLAWDMGDYFSAMRAPDAAAQDLARAARDALGRWQAQKLMIVGYSFGADVAPFLVSRLPADLRNRVSVVALMGPSEVAPFQVTAAERVGLDNPGARPVRPELDVLARDGVKVACLYGQNDHDAICPSVQLRGLSLRSLPGGHGFKGDDAAVAREILAP